MEKSMRRSYEQGERGNFSSLLSISLGFSLYWVLLFVAILKTSLVDGFHDGGGGGISVPLPVAACAGIVIADMVIHRWCDFFSRERGHKVLWAVVDAGAIFPGLILFSHALKGSSGLDMLVLPAWIFFGMAIACLRSLWVELAVGFVKGFASGAIALSVCIGAVWCFLLNFLPIGISACFLCISPAISLATLKALEKELPAAPFVSREESLKRHRLTRPIDALNTAYGAAFGLIVYLLWQSEPSSELYFGIMVAVAAGAFIMLLLFKRNTDKMLHGFVQKVLFPVLVIGLVPISLVDASARPVFILIVLCGFVCMMLASLDSLCLLVKKFEVSPFYLIGRGSSPLLVGFATGFAVAYVALVLNSVDEAFIAVVSLMLVVVLSVVITLVDFDRDYLEDERQGESGTPEIPLGVDSYAIKCELVAGKYGLSAREIEVFYLLARGRGAKYIQEKLCVSESTVKSHTYKIHKKLGVASREDLITLVENEPLQGLQSQSGQLRGSQD